MASSAVLVATALILVPTAGSAKDKIRGSESYEGLVNGSAGTVNVTVVNNVGPGSGCKFAAGQTIAVNKVTSGGSSTGSGTSFISVSATVAGVTYTFTTYSNSSGDAPQSLSGATPCGGQSEQVTFSSSNTSFVPQTITVNYTGPSS